MQRAVNSLLFIGSVKCVTTFRCMDQSCFPQWYDIVLMYHLLNEPLACKVIVSCLHSVHVCLFFECFTLCIYNTSAHYTQDMT